MPASHPRSPLDGFVDQPALAGTLELVWRQVQASLPRQRLSDWLTACHAIAADLGADAALAYIRNSPVVAAGAGADAALALADAAPSFAALAGSGAVRALFVAAPAAARRLATPGAFAEWLRILAGIAERAPESVSLLLDRSERVLAALDLRSLEAWALGGIRAAENDAERRLRFFALLDPAALQALAQSDDLSFTAIERELKAYGMALFHKAPPLRPAASPGLDMPRRAGFDHGVVYLPSSFRGFSGAAGKALYRAALAHILAHFRFTPAKFPVGSLKPVQVALVSLIEDARIEQLALALYPGLRRLWQPFHTASPSGAATAPVLMARLSRALLDPAYDDDHFWVRRGRGLFFADSARWHDPALSRTLGGLLGNDLGQMRVQFNARTYAVEPVYRDDNQGLWDFPSSSTPDAAEAVYAAARFDTAEAAPPDRERDSAEGDATNRASPVAAAAEIGLPVAQYPEWDFLIGSERAQWTTVCEYLPAEASARRIDAVLERYPEQLHRIAALIRAAKLSRPQRLRRQSEGDRLDLEAAIAAAIDRRIGLAPSPKIYARLERRWRDLSVLLLLDASHSTNDVVRGAGRSVLELERDAAALLAHAMDGLGDPFAIHAFCSDTRADIRYYRLKDFDASYGEAAKRRLAGLSGRFSTRMGAALRHAGHELAQRSSYRRLLLLISDGEPSDVDIADRRYLVEDARRAVLSLSHRGIDVFCVALDAGGDAWLTRIFGRRNVLQLDRIERLPEKLPLLYFRLAG